MVDYHIGASDDGAIGPVDDLSDSDDEEEEDDEDDPGEHSSTLSLHFIQIYAASDVLDSCSACASKCTIFSLDHDNTD